jgi:phospholipid/cholesterol/gamma-HCH transport system permease protein
MNIAVVDRGLIRFFHGLQSYFSLGGGMLLRIFRRPSYYREFVVQFDKLGFSSLFICLLTGLFSGMVMALQALIQLKPFAATSYVGGMVAATMIKELGPVLAALMVAGRGGSAITAELGTMVVTEQVDAMRVEGTDIIQRLATPRLKAMLLAMPLLTVATDVISLVGGYVMSAGYGINPIMYVSGLSQFMVFQDLIEGLVKPLFFGLIIAVTGCYIGLNTRGGAEGVGAAAKQAVVLSSVTILVSDFFISKIFVAFR